MKKVQWLGGPGDGNWVEIPDEDKYLSVQGLEGKKFIVPIKQIPVSGEHRSKLVLDYYDKVEDESVDS